MDVKHILKVSAVFCTAFFAVRTASAQTIEVPAGYELVDSVVYIRAAAVDTVLSGKNIFQELPLVAKGDAADVKVHQSQYISVAMHQYFNDNSSRVISGYRVRIFFDNRQTSRTASEATLYSFMEKYPDVDAYRSYVNPYFKVTVGDCRTKSEAMQLLERIKDEFPTSFIVKENINYPVTDKSRPVLIDTVKVLRPLPEQIL